MYVADALSRIRPGIHDDPEPALGNAVLRGKPARNRHGVPDGLLVLRFQLDRATLYGFEVAA